MERYVCVLIGLLSLHLAGGMKEGQKTVSYNSNYHAKDYFLVIWSRNTTLLRVVLRSFSFSCPISSKSQYINISRLFSRYVDFSPEICESVYDTVVFEKVLCASASYTKICIKWEYYFNCICRTICYMGCVVDTVAFIKVSLQVLWLCPIITILPMAHTHVSFISHLSSWQHC